MTWRPADDFVPRELQTEQLWLRPLRGSDADNGGRVSSMRSLGVLRQVASADARIQLVEERVQPTLARLTRGHLQQNLAYFSGRVLDRPADLTVTDTRVATAVELQRQCGIGRRTDNVLCLMDIRQGMRVSARRRRAGGASGGSCSRVTDRTCGGMRLQSKGTQPRGTLSPRGKPANAFNRRTGPCI